MQNIKENKKNTLFLFFLLSSVLYIRKKLWNRKNFQLPVTNEFTCFRMSLIKFNYFYKISMYLSVCV